jgi:cytochrome P450
LREYPGPVLAAITALPLFRNRLNGTLVPWYHALHLKYGSVVRVAPNELSYIDPNAWKDIYGHRTASKPSFPKDPRFLGPDLYCENGETGMVRADDEAAHSRQRRLVSYAFSDKALKEQEPLLQSYAELLVTKLKDAVSKDKDVTFNMIEWYNFTTFDIMADLAFGESMGLIASGKYNDWVGTIVGFIKAGVIMQACRAIPGAMELLEFVMPKSLVAKKEAFKKFGSDQVNKRLATKTERPDIWTYVLRFQNSEEETDKKLSLNEMHSNAAAFMVAGTETTATLMSGVTYLLLKHPEAMQTLVNEIRETFPTSESMTMQALAGLTYLTACLMKL